MAVGVEDLGFDGELHSTETRAGFFFLMSRGLPAVDQDIGVMNQALVAGPDLDGLQPASAVDRSAKDKVPESIRAVRGQQERFLGFDDYIRVAELPAFDELRL